MITIKDYNKEGQKISFVTDMSVSLANAVRRSVLEIPVMAIDEVEIVKNDSALYDEIIAHRLGLVPIKAENNKAVKFKLVSKGPATVYSDELVPAIGTSLKIPIVHLDKGQEIEMVCNANLGIGIDHIKYSPGLVFYKHNLPEKILDFVTVNEDGKVSFDEEELKIKGLDEDLIKEIRAVKEVKELEVNTESWGQIDVKDIFLKSVDVLDENLKEVLKAVK